MKLRPSSRQGSPLSAVLGAVIGTFVLVTSGCETNTTEADLELISVSEVSRLMADAERRPSSATIILIDPRSEREYQEAHIPGAINLTLADVGRDEKIDKSIARHNHIVVYGNNPASPSARGMAKRLMANGYDDVRFLEAGLEAWLQQGGKVDRRVSGVEVAPTGDASTGN
jgi:3-mercaptopyruvate sulfurtransferase SseA